MQSKSCFKCKQTKPLSEFYAHPMMADGRLGKCKECNKKDVRENYAARRSQYHAYEATRNKTESRKQQLRESLKRQRAANPLKNAARRKVRNELLSGRLVRPPCSVCGNPKSQAHHHDYTKPLDVEWLCFTCHRREHGQNPTCIK
jgi:hypothetical protein